MNSIKCIGIFCFILLAWLGGGSFLSAQTKQEITEQKEKEIKERVESGHFIVSVDRALPMRGRSVHLTTLYSLELKGDSVISYLPYFGRAYTAPYGGGNSMDFAERVTGYHLSYTKKGAAVIEFKAKTQDDRFAFRLLIYPDGSTTIQVIPVNRQSITYYGKVVAKEQRVSAKE